MSTYFRRSLHSTDENKERKCYFIIVYKKITYSPRLNKLKNEDWSSEVYISKKANRFPRSHVNNEILRFSCL